MRSTPFFLAAALSAASIAAADARAADIDSVEVALLAPPPEAVPSSPRSRAAAARAEPLLRTELARTGLEFGAPVFMRIFKQEKALELWVESRGRFRRFKTYDICLYSGGLGPKLRTGDLHSPEGFYAVGPESLNPLSQRHLSFNLGFPNDYDRMHGRTGSFLMVHGGCSSIGCYAMTDRSIEEIFTLAAAALRAGQERFPVHVFPFRMTADNLAAHGASPWAGFWANLKEGYDSFERTGRPPKVGVRDRRYIFADG